MDLNVLSGLAGLSTGAAAGLQNKRRQEDSQRRSDNEMAIAKARGASKWVPGSVANLVDPKLFRDTNAEYPEALVQASLTSQGAQKRAETARPTNQKPFDMGKAEKDALAAAHAVWPKDPLTKQPISPDQLSDADSANINAAHAGSLARSGAANQQGYQQADYLSMSEETPEVPHWYGNTPAKKKYGVNPRFSAGSPPPADAPAGGPPDLPPGTSGEPPAMTPKAVGTKPPSAWSIKPKKP